MDTRDWGRNLSRRAMLANVVGLVASLRGAPALAHVGRFAPAAAPKWDDRFELVLDFEIAQPNGGRSNRPYVAVWVEDAAGLPVRTLSLWVDASRGGSRWIRDLRRWFRNEQARSAASGGDLVAAISSATRRPGRYSLVWDGRNDAGQPVDQGVFFICIETARENGPYQLLRQDFTFAAEPFRAEIGRNVEIAGASVEYRIKAA